VGSGTHILVRKVRNTREDIRSNKKPTIYSIGDVIRHRVTGEEGQIVRLVNLSDIFLKPTRRQENESAYIVSLPQESLTPAREALWLQTDVDESSATRLDEGTSGSGELGTASEE
jgi:hypothetical protein